MQQLQQSEATAAQRRIFFHAVDATDGIAAETGLTGTGWFSKDGATPTASSGSIVEVSATNMPGRYYIEATAGELDTLGIIEFRFKTAACAEVVARAQVVPWDTYDAVRMGLTSLPNAAAEAAGGLYTRGTGAGQINQPANGSIDGNLVTWVGAAPNALASGKVACQILAAADFVQAAADKVWSSTTRTLSAFSTALALSVWDVLETAIVTASSIGLKLKNNLDVVLSTRSAPATLQTSNVTQINGVSAAAVRLALAAGTIVPGTVDITGFTPTTTEFEADDITVAGADHFNGRKLIFTDPALQDQATEITDYVLTGGRGHFTVVALSVAPSDNDTFVIV